MLTVKIFSNVTKWLKRKSSFYEDLNGVVEIILKWSMDLTEAGIGFYSCSISY